MLARKTPNKMMSEKERKTKLFKLVSQAQFHGARRVMDRHRWYWVSALVLLLVASVLVLIQNITRFLDRPTFLIKLSSVRAATPFPTVVVCPEVQFPDYKQDAFVDQLKLQAGTNKTYIRGVLQQLAAFYSGDIWYNTHDLGVLQSILEYNELGVEDSVRRLTASCEETLLECQWLGQSVACMELFRMEVTGDGFCCVFNGRSLRRELSFEGVYRSRYPRHKWFKDEFGPFNGLVAVVNQSQRLDNIDLTYKWVSLQHGQRYVDTRMNGSALSPGLEHWFGYSTIGFRVVEPSLKDMPQKLRRCRMHYEEPLQFFPVYGRTYCQVECEMFHTLRRCGCIRPTHPRPPGLHVCKAQDLACARHAAVTYNAPFCNCPMTCDIDTTVTKVFSYPLIPDSSSYDPIYLTGNFDRRSIIRVFIDGHKRKTFAQRPLFTELDLYAQLGGIFNMCFGCSILTLLEMAVIAYHTLRRWHWKLHRQKPNKQPEITKFGGNLIKPTAQTTIYRDGIFISFNQTHPKVAKKSNLKKKSRVGFSQ